MKLPAWMYNDTPWIHRLLNENSTANSEPPYTELLIRKVSEIFQIIKTFFLSVSCPLNHCLRHHLPLSQYRENKTDHKIDLKLVLTLLKGAMESTNLVIQLWTPCVVMVTSHVRSAHGFNSGKFVGILTTVLRLILMPSP